MIFNRPRAAKKKRLTWYFNDKITIIRNMTYTATFTCDRVKYTTIHLTSGFNSTMRYDNNTTAYIVMVGWMSEDYRTITFKEEPTGDLLAFLEANATPQ